MRITALPVVVINLERNPDRWKYVSDMLRRNEFENVEKLEAVNGKNLPMMQVREITDSKSYESLFRHRTKHEDLGSVGAVGCYLSHMNAWKKCVASEKPLIVVEDDVMLRHLVDNVDIPDDADVVLLGYLVLRESHPKERGVVPYNKFFFGSHFYYITPKGAQKLLDNAYPIQAQLDTYMSRQAKKQNVNMYIHVPNMAIQNPRFVTDIQTHCAECGDWKVSRTTTSAVWIIVFLLVVITTLVSILVKRR